MQVSSTCAFSSLEVSGLGYRKGLPHLLVGGIGLPGTKIRRDGPRERVRTLRDDPDTFAQQIRIEFAHVKAARVAIITTNVAMITAPRMIPR